MNSKSHLFSVLGVEKKHKIKPREKKGIDEFIKVNLFFILSDRYPQKGSVIAS